MSENKDFKDLNDILTSNDSEQDLDLLSIDNKKNKQKDEKNNKEDNSLQVKKSFNLKRLLLTSVLPSVSLGLIGLISGVVLGGSSATPINNTPVISSISNGVSLVDRVSDVKDSQLKALESKVKAINNSASSGDVKLEAISINSKISNATLSILDSLLQDVLNDNPKKSVVDKIASYKKHFSISEPVNGELDDFSKQVQMNMESFINSESIAQQLNTEVAKSGVPIVSLLSMLADNSVIYQVIVPAVTAKGDVYNVLYLVKLSDANKVIAMSYEGYIDGSDGLHYFES